MSDPSSHEHLPLSGRLRLLRPLSIPFVLSLVALLVAGAFLDGRRRLDQEQEAAAWEETARRAVGRIRAGQRLEDWIDRMSNRFQHRLEAVVFRHGVGAWSAGLVERVARASFDARVWRSRAGVFLVARKAGGEWAPLPWPGTPPGQARLVSRVIEDFTVLAGGGEIPAARLESLKRRSTGLFGPVGEPAVMGRHQAGILTPVTWNGAPAHLVWNVVSVRGRPVG
ncbi:MAG: hypothetical protein GX442_18675, partial [Candidatus Riflebacteria bacterium]|nr:hypothetical protein [Candidatus Riflebacteria bacterium]